MSNERSSEMIKRLLKQCFCKHEWSWFKVPQTGKFVAISGERQVLACSKCQKINHKSETFVKYEGNGFK